MIFNDERLPRYIIRDEGNATKDIKEIFNKYYDLGTVVDVQRHTIGNSNFNYFVTAEKNGKESKYFAQLFSTSKTLVALKYELSLREYYVHNNKSGMKCASPFMTSNGSYTVICHCEDIDMDRYFCVFSLLDGESAPRGEWAEGKMTKKLIRSCARGIAAFHAGAYGFKTPEVCEELDRSFEEEMEHYKYVFTEEYERLSKDSDYEYFDYFGKYQPKLLEILEHYTGRYLKVKDELPECICQLDTSPQNYLFDENLKPVGVCDLDISRKFPRLFDIGWFINEGLCSFNPEEQTNSIKTDDIREFIRAYDEEMEAMGNPLPGKITQKEKEMVVDFFVFASIMCGFYYIWDYIIHGNTTNSCEYYIYWGDWTKTAFEFLEQHLDEFCTEIKKI